MVQTPQQTYVYVKLVTKGQIKFAVYIHSNIVAHI